MTLVLFEGGLFTIDPLLIEDFNPTKAVATCHMVCNGKTLILKRSDSTIEGQKWCMPGGKLEKNETPLQAVIREIKEETGILMLPEETHFMVTLCIRMLASKQDYLLQLFKATLSSATPSDYMVILNQEHTDYLWVNPATVSKLDLLAGGKEISDFLCEARML